MGTPSGAGITRCSPAVLIRARCSRRRHAHAQIRVRDWNAAAVRSFGKEGQALTMRQVSLLIQRCAARPCSAKDVSEQHLAFLFGAFFEIANGERYGPLPFKRFFDGTSFHCLSPAQGQSRMPPSDARADDCLPGSTPGKLTFLYNEDLSERTP